MNCLPYPSIAILVYGVLASIISDKVSEFISKKVERGKVELIAGVLDIVFGLILLWYSLVASILFFITDRIL